MADDGWSDLQTFAGAHSGLLCPDCEGDGTSWDGLADCPACDGQGLTWDYDDE
jgi:DnaJ-class molecular chaperone